MHSKSPIKSLFLYLLAICLVPRHLLAWTDGELLIWMDPDRGQALKPLAERFEKDLGVDAKVETPEKLTENFPLAAQVGKGPDIVIWAHDKVGEWADAGLIAPVGVSDAFSRKFFPKAWQAVRHENRTWGYPIALETVTLIYNRKLLDVPPPTELSQLESVSQRIKMKHPAVTAILWDYKSAYYSWGILDRGRLRFCEEGNKLRLEQCGRGDSRIRGGTVKNHRLGPRRSPAQERLL